MKFTGLFLLIWFAASGAMAQKISAGDAVAQCKQKLGPGAIAEEELEFGETTYVCNCASPFGWNEDNTACVGGNASTAPETPDFTTRPDTGKAPEVEQRTAKQLFDKARNNYNSGEFAIAAFWYKKAAAKESVGAMINLGVMYNQGKGVRKQPEEAVRWFRRGADIGNPVAMLQLSRALNSGKGVKRDNQKSFRWVLKAAQKGYAPAMASAGNKYLFGKGVKLNNAEAARWFQEAIDNGNTDEIYNLGILYDLGNGVRRDPKRAAKLIAQALKDGDTFALENISSAPERWSKPFRRELQRIMKREGVYSGAVDGIFGPITRKALGKMAGQ